MKFLFEDREYHFQIGSDLQRDGVFLEVAETEVGPEMFDIFYSDQSHRMIFTAFQPDIPLELIEWAIAMAKARLIPEDEP